MVFACADRQMAILFRLAILWACYHVAAAEKQTGCNGNAEGWRFQYELLRDYGNGHSLHKLSITVLRPTKNWAVYMCFDGQQCITNAGSLEMEVQDTVIKPSCYVFYSRDDEGTQGKLISIDYRTYTPSIVPYKPSRVFLYGNYVVTRSITNPDVAPNPIAFCHVCDGGYAKSADGCDKFVQCANRRPITSSCPPTLQFNPMSNVCDYAFNTGCGQSHVRRRRLCRFFAGECNDSRYLEYVQIASCDKTR